MITQDQNGYTYTPGDSVTVTLPPALVLRVGQQYEIAAGERVTVVVANAPPRSWWDRLRYRVSQWIYPH